MRIAINIFPVLYCLEIGLSLMLEKPKIIADNFLIKQELEVFLEDKNLYGAIRIA